MRPTTPGILLLLLVLAALAAPVAAAAQSKGPAALWDAFPLDQATTTPAPGTATPPAVATPAPATPPAAAPKPSGDDGIPVWIIIAGAFAVLVVGGGVAIFTLARLRERRQTSADAHPAPVPEPQAAPEPDPVPVSEPVAVAVAPAPARAAEPVERPARPDPPSAAPAPPVTAAPPAPPARPAPVEATAAEAGEVVTADDLELAELAAEYLWTVATGSRRPVVDLAARRFMRVGRAREMLSRARARGILTGAGRGRPGGALTEKGRRILEAESRSPGAPARPDTALPAAVAPPEATPTGPPHLRLAEGDEETGGTLSASVAASEEDDTTGRALTVLEGGARNLP
jgi:hypothetical protein